MITRTCLGALIVSMATLHANATTRDDIVGTRTEATWRVQSFVFRHSSSVAYSCRALHDKIAAILQAVGAADGAIVALDCRGGMLRTARAHITLASPVEATASSVEMPRWLTARAELVARLRNAPAPSAAPIERFPATWRRVALRRYGHTRLDASDCELVREMVKQVFPRLATHVRGRPMCSNGVTRGMPREVVALVRDGTA